MRASGGIRVSCDDGVTPLVVDLDGTLIRSDLLVESAFAHVGADALRIGALLLSLSKGKAALKAEIASDTAIDVAHLPYDDRIVALVREAREAGRQSISPRPATSVT